MPIFTTNCFLQPMLSIKIKRSWLGSTSIYTGFYLVNHLCKLHFSNKKKTKPKFKVSIPKKMEIKEIRHQKIKGKNRNRKKLHRSTERQCRRKGKRNLASQMREHYINLTLRKRGKNCSMASLHVCLVRNRWVMRNLRAPTWREHSVSFLELFTFISLSSKPADLRPGVGAPTWDVVRRNDLKSKIRYFQFLKFVFKLITIYKIYI